MTRNEIIQELKKYFSVKELVCNHTFSKWGEQSWQFLDTDLLHVILILRRDILKAGIFVNGGSKKYTERGLRCNMCSLVKNKKSIYLSSHILGKAIDATITGMTAEQARTLIKANAQLLPCNIRLEGGVTWLHVDVLPQYGCNDKVYVFTV